jgi:hypothetical protein
MQAGVERLAGNSCFLSSPLRGQPNTVDDLSGIDLTGSVPGTRVVVKLRAASQRIRRGQQELLRFQRRLWFAVGPVAGLGQRY